MSSRSNRSSQARRAHVLLTGATGFVGKVVLHELMRRRAELGIERVSLLIRAKRGAKAEDRFAAKIAASECFRDLPTEWVDCIDVVSGDVSEAGAGISGATRSLLTRELTHVIHCAASVEFHLPVAQAAASNVTGSLNVLELAGECTKLERMVDVSTAYVTPHTGDERVVREELFLLPADPDALYTEIANGGYDTPEREAALLARMGHPNTYTFTKCLAENLLARRRANVPLSIVRPSIVSASLKRPFAGWIDSPAAFALLTMMIGSGRMRALIGRRDSRIDTVPVDYVADQILASTFQPLEFDTTSQATPQELEIVHAVAGLERSPRLDTCVAHVSRFFSENRAPGTEDTPIGLRYLGSDGLRFRLWHLYVHALRTRARPYAKMLAETTRRFSYFTQNTFHFESSGAPHGPDIGGADYLDTICRGVYVHLMKGEALS